MNNLCPTSIIFYNSSTASEILGYTPKYINYNVKSAIQKLDNSSKFIPIAQTLIRW